MHKILPFLVIASVTASASATLTTQYDFSGDLMPSINVGGVTDTILGNKNKLFDNDPATGSTDATPTYSTQTVGGASDSVLNIGRYNAMNLVLGLPGNNPAGTFPYQYTIVQDVKLGTKSAFTLLDPGANGMSYNRALWIDENGHPTFGDLSQNNTVDYSSIPNPPLADGVGSATIDVTQWHRYALAVDITNHTASLYVDGDLSLTVSGLVNDKYRLGKFNNATSFFGSTLNVPNTASNPFGLVLRDGYGSNAYLAQLQAYDTTLSASEIKSLGSLAPVPEPTTFVALGLGLAAISRRRRRA